jgi:hypothetical protein
LITACVAIERHHEDTDAQGDGVREFRDGAEIAVAAELKSALAAHRELSTVYRELG